MSGSTTTVSLAAGETSRLLVQGIGINSNATITPGSSQTNLSQVNGTGASIEVNDRATGSAIAMTGSWAGATGLSDITIALLPPNQVVTDAGDDGTTSTATGSISNGTTTTITLAGNDQNTVVIVAVGILNSSSQTVSSVTVGGYTAFRLSTIANGTNVSTDLWYYYLGTNQPAIVVTLSASANAVIAAAAFSNASQITNFEGTGTATGNSATASDTVSSGTANRRILFVSSFATAATPTGSQGVNIAGTNANSIGIGLNYLDSSGTNSMAATSKTSSNWTAIGTALRPFPINVDATCSSTGNSVSSINCSLNHAANVLIVIFSGIYDGNNSGNGTVSSVTVAGNPATAVNLNNVWSTVNTSNGSGISIFYYYSTVAANDSIVANYSGASNNPISLAVVSFTGLQSNQTAYFNGLQFGRTCQPTTCGSYGLAEGGLNRLALAGTEVPSTELFVETQNHTDSPYDAVQVSGNSNAFDFMVDPNSNTAGGPSVNWSTNVSGAAILNLFLLAPNQISVAPVDCATCALTQTTTPTGGEDVFCIIQSANATSGTCTLPQHDANILLVIVIGVINGSSQTVSSVTLGSNNFTRLSTVANGTSISTDVWYFWDANSGAETITINFSGPATAFFAYAAGFINTASANNCIPASNCFDQPTTNTGNGTITSVAVGSGTANRLTILATSFVGVFTACCNGNGITMIGASRAGGQADLTDEQGNMSANANGTSDLSIYLQPSGNANTISTTTTGSSNPWAAIGTGLQPQITSTVTQPVQITVQNSAPSGNFTLSGCAASPTTVTSDGNIHNITAYASCALTVFVPTDGSNSRYRFNSPATNSITFTTCSNGTCGTQTYTAYYQLQNTYQLTANGQSTFDTGMSWNVQGTVLGTASTTGCTISSSASTTDTCSAWFDYDLPVTIANIASTPPPNTAWITEGTASWTQTTGGNTNNANSWKEYQSVTFNEENQNSNPISCTSTTITASNGTSINNPGASLWWTAGTTTLTSCVVSGSNIVNSPNPTASVASSSATYIFTITVTSPHYTIVLSQSMWHSVNGNSLVNPGNVNSFTITCPNSTTMTSYGTYYLTSGTYTLTAVTYQISVEPSIAPTFNPTNGNPTFNINVLTVGDKLTAGTAGTYYGNTEYPFSSLNTYNNENITIGISGVTFPNQLNFYLQNATDSSYPLLYFTSSNIPLSVLNAKNYTWNSLDLLQIFGQQLNQSVTVNYGSSVCNNQKIRTQYQQLLQDRRIVGRQLERNYNRLTDWKLSRWQSIQSKQSVTT